MVLACCAVAVLAQFCFAAASRAADAPLPAGDLSLRHDLQLLVDHGVIKGAITSWPLAWRPILRDVTSVDGAYPLSVPVSLALARVRDRASRETRRGAFQYSARVAAAENPARLRSFAYTPRESGEVDLGISRVGERLTLQLHAQAVTSPDDGKEFRADHSMLGVAIGNFSIAASTMDRWWGPGWDGNLILTNNARPIPALTIDREFTDPFESRWLSWLGPWDMSIIFGQMESERVVPDTRFFGFRFNFRPLPSLEIGLSRSAQWCGEGRPCDGETFFDLLIGRDNRGGDGVDLENEPGNQLAGVDFRWSTDLFERPLAVYGQFIGEDEAGGFPSRYLVQTGIETNGAWRETASWRLFAELAGTSCDFIKEDIFDCGYNHAIYQTGYRYRGRAVGHTADNDARLVSVGFMVVEAEGHSWWAIARGGDLNRGGAPDSRHSVTQTRQRIMSLDVYHSRSLRLGMIEIGAGVEQVDDAMTGHSDTDARAFIRWRSSR